ncbi:hypothetical protein [Mycolicibacterium sphagni]|uniref:Uncharacterized protein n=1 Tax=Mycolicibacterium sphagni TaxID=1786 RepID=A0A255DPE5_9MYCO|nr:hypothetical protein [Mycolicibacterium sphagni]OYN81278.1 hypothetical protein CG716_07075 [Mycolicibacterium sphagni]
MARDGSPDPSNYSDSDPTQYANYGGSGGEAYSEFQQADYAAPTGYGGYPPPEPTPWYRKPAALVGFGVLTAIVLALLVYAVVKFTGSNGSGPAGTSTTSPTTSTSAGTSAATSAPGAPQAPVTQTVTESPTATSEAPATTTTTEAPVTTTTTEPSTSTSTSTSVSTSVSTVTQTVTTRERPTLPNLFPRPNGGQ